MAPVEEFALFWNRLLPHSNQIYRYWDAKADLTFYAGDIGGILRTGQVMPKGLGGWVALLHPEDREGFQRYAQATLEGHDTGVHEYRLWRQDGTFQMVREHACTLRIDKEGKLGLMAMIADVSNACEVEQQLQHLQKMEAFSRLVGGVAHDFNNLLTIICGYTEIMLDGARAPEEMRPLLAEVQVAANRASALTSQLLAFNQPKTVSKPQDFDFNDLLRDAGRMLRRILGAQVELEVEPAAEACVVTAFRGRWEQGLIEMAVLVREGMSQGGSIIMKAKRGCADPGGGAGSERGLLLTVEGRPRTPNPRLPLPHLSTGFLESLQFIRQSGGKVEPGREGTRIWLPLALKSAGNQDGEKVRSEKGGETILLVEDESTVRRLAMSALARGGFKILEAQNGDDALALMQNPGVPRADIMITDMLLPGMDGRELADQILEICPQMRVLFVSGYPCQTNNPMTGIEAQSAFLQKPFAPRALIAQVRALLDRVTK